MSNFFGLGDAHRFAPDAGDSIRELRWKAESMLEHLRENEATLRKFPTGAVDERLALWEPLAELLEQAMEDPELEEDARLESQRVWAEEMRHSALVTVTMCVHCRSEAARQRFSSDPERLEELVEQLEAMRPSAMKVLSTEDRDGLRAAGFLREGE